jgi:hypothetical protein
MSRTLASSTTERTDFLADHLTEALAVASLGEEQDDHVLDRAGEDDTHDDPDGPRQVAHLRSKHRSDQRSSLSHVLATATPKYDMTRSSKTLRSLGLRLTSSGVSAI